MKIIIANFKSHKTLTEYQHWLDAFAKQKYPSHLEVVLTPSFVALPMVSMWIDHQKTPVSLGVQDVSAFPAGAYTGEVSTRNLQDLHIQYAVIGHSERRRYMHETSQDVANKVREVIDAGMTPIVCVRHSDIHEQAGTLGDLKNKVMVAYEPVEHIGTGEPDSLENILETRKLVIAAFGQVPYLYGGSIDHKTDSALLGNDLINGFIVGTASLDPGEFGKLLESFPPGV